MKSVKAIVNLSRKNLRIELTIPIESSTVPGMLAEIAREIPEGFRINDTRLVSIFFFEEETKHG